MNLKYTLDCIGVLKNAEEFAKKVNHKYVDSCHILYAIMNRTINPNNDDDLVYSLIKDLDKESIKNEIAAYKQEEEEIDVKEDKYSFDAINILNEAAKAAVEYSCANVECEFLLLAILKDVYCKANILLKNIGVDISEMYGFLILSLNERLDAYEEGTEVKQGSTTDILDQVSVDLTELAEAKKLEPLVDREKEVQRLVQVLSRKTKNNPCLVGEPGVGKTTIVNGLAQLISEGKVPVTLKNKRLLKLNMTAVVSGTRYRGDFEERVNNILKEIEERKDIILFIDELHTIVGGGKAEGTSDMANILKPALSGGDISIIGATTYEEYRRYIEKDQALSRRFMPVNVVEPSRDEAVKILKGIREPYQRYHNIMISDEALESAVDLSMRYINDRFLPDKAVDLIDEAASKKVVEYLGPGSEMAIKMDVINNLERKKDMFSNVDDIVSMKLIDESLAVVYRDIEKMKEKMSKKGLVELSKSDIEEVVAGITGINVERISKSEGEKLKNLEERIHERIVSQEHAVTAVAKAIRRGRAGIKDPNKPIGSFLFLGPTGVGKTELAKALARCVYESDKALVRVDMSEFMEKHSVSKLIGSPPGYVGHDDGGQLTKAVKKNPYSIILFDEIEKADPEVFNIFLQILDEGFLTDASGNKVDFRNTIVIMTSNIGAKRMVEQKTMGFLTDTTDTHDYEIMKGMVMDELKKSLRPELINRIDEIVVFRQLNNQELLSIVDILLGDLLARLKSNFNIKVRISKTVKDFIVKKGNDKKYGARPLKRAIQNHIEDKLAYMIVSGDIKENDNISITMKNEDINVKVL